ncbi:MAG: H-type lectin domain-containing protein [Loktanella sp.]|nr:H-type lectin domain-containing protein [Loktanella sp.]
MKTIKSSLIGIDQGDVIVFADYRDNGPMWSETGNREARQAVEFSDSYAEAPSVMVSVSMLDVSSEANVRTEVMATNVTTKGFDIVFRTWGDTRIARARVAWQSIGELASDDAWDI